MKFRKLLLCMVAGLFLTGFANGYTYAAEESTVTEEATIENTNEQAIATPNNTTEENTESLTEDKDDSNIEETIKNEPVANVEEDVKKNTAENDASTKTTKETTEAKKSAKNTESSKKSSDNKKTVTYTKAELRLLSALIYCEANSESYNGKLAVGIVVMNRVRSASFPDTVKGVIYQKYQFGPVSSGALSKALDEYDAGKFTSKDEKECIKAAKEALSGVKSITVNGKKVDFSKYLYFSGKLKNHTYALGNHQFK